MAETVETIKSKLDSLKTATTAALQRVADDVQALKDKLAQGVSVSQADLDAIGAAIDQETATLSGVDPLPDNPPPPAP